MHADSRELRACFYENAKGRAFTDFITTREDVERFTSMVATTRTTDTPGLITATLLREHGRQKVDSQLFVRHTTNGFILGTAVEKEQFAPKEGTNMLVPEPVLRVWSLC